MSASVSRLDGKLNDQKFIRDLTAAIVSGQLTQPLEIIRQLERWVNTNLPQP